MTQLLPPTFFYPAGAPGPGSTRLDTSWRAANQTALGQIYLRNTTLVRDALRPEHTKPPLIGHWGASARVEDHTYTRHHGENPPEISKWMWTPRGNAAHPTAAGG
jgi:phosphoketolase